jgi:S1-C subfamily serine protease
MNDARRRDLARRLRRALDGALVSEVVPGSPADLAGLKASVRSGYGSTKLGDLITEVGGQPIRSNEDLLCAVEESTPGSTITLTVARGCDAKRVEKLFVTPVALTTLRRNAQEGGGKRG